MRRRKRIKYHLFGSGTSIVNRIFEINGALLFWMILGTIAVGAINKIKFVNPTTECVVGLIYILFVSFTIMIVVEGVTNNFFYAYTRERYHGEFLRDWFKEGYTKAKARYDEGMSWARLMNRNPDLEYQLDELDMNRRMRTIRIIDFHRKRYELYLEYGVYNKELPGYHYLWCQDPKWKKNRSYNKSIAREMALKKYPNDHAYDDEEEQLNRFDDMIYEMYGQEGLDARGLTGKALLKKEAELNAKRGVKY